VNPSDGISDPVFRREIFRAFGFPMLMFALAIIPGLNITYSGHGGICWFLAPLCFPWVVLRAAMRIMRAAPASRAWYLRFYAITIPSYIALALPLSWAATTSIRMTFGLSLSAWSFLAIMVSPIPWWYFR
jgi:hypothetical protein